MASFIFHCPFCKQKLRVAVERVGKMAKCPTCRQKFVVKSDSSLSQKTVDPNLILHDGEIVVKCPECQTLKVVSELFVGLKTKCKKCGSLMDVVPLPEPADGVVRASKKSCSNLILHDGEIAVKCPECQTLKVVSELFVGLKTKCKKCGSLMDVVPLPEPADGVVRVSKKSCMEASRINNKTLCPYCNEPVSVSAVICPHCRSDIFRCPRCGSVGTMKYHPTVKSEAKSIGGGLVGALAGGILFGPVGAILGGVGGSMTKSDGYLKCEKCGYRL